MDFLEAYKEHLAGKRVRPKYWAQVRSSDWYSFNDEDYINCTDIKKEWEVEKISCKHPPAAVKPFKYYPGEGFDPPIHIFRCDHCCMYLEPIAYKQWKSK